MPPKDTPRPSSTAQAPMIDGLMKELGLHGGSLDGMVGTTPVLDLEETPQSPRWSNRNPPKSPRLPGRRLPMTTPRLRTLSKKKGGSIGGRPFLSESEIACEIRTGRADLRRSSLRQIECSGRYPDDHSLNQAVCGPFARHHRLRRSHGHSSVSSEQREQTVTPPKPGNSAHQQPEGKHHVKTPRHEVAVQKNMRQNVVHALQA